MLLSYRLRGASSAHISLDAAAYPQYRSPQMMQRFCSELAHQAPYAADVVSSEERRLVILACLGNIAEQLDNASANAEPSVTLLATPINVEALIVFVGAQCNDGPSVTSSSASTRAQNSIDPNNSHDNASVPLTFDDTDDDSDVSIMTSSSGY